MKRGFDINGKIYEKALDLIGLTLNANALPGDQGGAFKPNGVRLGTPAITTRGLGKKEMQTIAEWMEKIAKLCQGYETVADFEKANSKEILKLQKEVKTLSLKFPVPSL